MILRAVMLAALAAVLASFLFSLHRAGTFREWLKTTPDKPPEFRFDNGSVRDAAGPPASQASAVATGAPPGVLRKCVRGDRVTYSNLACPNGFREQAVRGDNVTVMPSDRATRGEAAKREAAAPAGGGTGAQKSLREAVDLERDPELRQRIMERAIAAGSK